MKTNEIATKQDIEEVKDFMREFLKSTLNDKTEVSLLDTKQTRALLANISEGTLKKLCDTGELTPSKIGGQNFYEMRDIKSMIKRNKIRS